MKTRRLVTLALAAAAVFVALAWSGKVVPNQTGQLISQAEAIIGRPLTPMSYAGVARRTVRRCAAGVYYC
jgi:hypothetical protein